MNQYRVYLTKADPLKSPRCRLSTGSNFVQIRSVYRKIRTICNSTVSTTSNTPVFESIPSELQSHDRPYPSTAEPPPPRSSASVGLGPHPEEAPHRRREAEAVHWREAASEQRGESRCSWFERARLWNSKRNTCVIYVTDVKNNQNHMVEISKFQTTMICSTVLKVLMGAPL